MIRKCIPLLAVGALTSCTGAKDPVGVWLIEIGYFTTQEEETRTITHNYMNAVPESEEPDQQDPYWTYEDTEDMSPMVMFGEIFEYDGEESEYVLYVMDRTLPGSEQEDGTFLFTWTGFEHWTESDTYVTNYNFTEVNEEDFTWTVTLDLAEAAGTGTFGFLVVDSVAYSETDLFDYMAIGEFGKTPAEDWLESTTAGTVENRAMTTDCISSPCTLSVVEEETLEVPITATRTSVETGDYGSVEEGGQPPGTGESRIF